MLDEGSDLKFAQDTTTQMRADGLSYADGLQYIRDNFDGKKEDLALAQWKQSNREDREAEQQMQADGNDVLWAWTISNPGKRPPVSLMQGADPKTQAAVLRDIENGIYTDETRASREIGRASCRERV